MLQKLKVWIYDKIYKCYDKRLIKGVYVLSYWKLKKVKVGTGYLMIPMTKRRINEDEQVLLIIDSFRKAMGRRILSKVK